MSIELREDGVCWVQEYSLNDFVHSIQKMVQGGFVISLKNEHYPQGYSGNFYCGMVRPESIANETTLKASTASIADQSNTPTLAKDEAKATESVTSPVKTTRATKKTT